VLRFSCYGFDPLLVFFFWGYGDSPTLLKVLFWCLSCYSSRVPPSWTLEMWLFFGGSDSTLFRACSFDVLRLGRFFGCFGDETFLLVTALVGGPSSLYGPDNLFNPFPIIFRVFVLIVGCFWALVWTVHPLFLLFM